VDDKIKEDEIVYVARMAEKWVAFKCWLGNLKVKQSLGVTGCG
jgi:hypothetical protein